MRIIAGSKRGMKLLPPKNMETRPVTDRAKEALFSVIYKWDMPADCVVADLFCGTGSMGLESLSRGAKHATFIDQSAQVIDLLERNIAKARFEAESKVIRGNVFKIGAPVGFEEPLYDLVFVDPPYAMARDTTQKSRLGRLLHLLCEQVRPGGIVIVRAHKRTELEDQYGNLHVIDNRSWGTTAVTILQLQSDEASDDE